jgi:hypothetical protein
VVTAGDSWLMLVTVVTAGDGDSGHSGNSGTVDGRGVMTVMAVLEVPVLTWHW